MLRVALFVLIFIRREISLLLNKPVKLGLFEPLLKAVLVNSLPISTYPEDDEYKLFLTSLGEATCMEVIVQPDAGSKSMKLLWSVLVE
jgi:hypothetical protein